MDQQLLRSWKARLYGDEWLARFYRYSPFAYCIGGLVTVLLRPRLLACDPGMWWNAIGATLVLMGIMCRRGDPER